MARIFVNYRRKDSDFAALQVADYLRREFGESQVFFDVKNIQSGEEWAKIIRRALRECDIFVVVMRANWLSELRNRLNTAEPDWVRIEIQFAIDHGLKILPLLIDSTMPSKSDLPIDIQDLPKYQGIDVRYRYFEADIIALKQAIDKVINPVSKLDIEHATLRTTASNVIPPKPATLPEISPISTSPSPALPPSQLHRAGPTRQESILRNTNQKTSKRFHALLENILKALYESDSWKGWGLTTTSAIIVVVTPITLILSLATTIGWGGIVLGVVGGVIGFFIGSVIPKAVLHTFIGTVLGIIFGIVGGTIIGLIHALINQLSIGNTVISFVKDITVISIIIGALLGVLSGLGRQSYYLDDERVFSAGILGLLGLILGVAIAVDAWGPSVPFMDVIGHLILNVLFWDILLGLISGLLGIVAGVAYDKFFE